jgi:hypothetical protein
MKLIYQPSTEASRYYPGLTPGQEIECTAAEAEKKMAEGCWEQPAPKPRKKETD